MRIIITILFFAISLAISAQEEVFENSGNVNSGGFAYGFKGGPTIATQSWNGFQRNGLISYHGDLFVESLGAWKQKGNISQRSGFQAQLGYHRKGSTFRNVFIYDQFNNKIRIPSNLFHNISLGLLGKGAFQLQEKSLAYYAIGITVDYTVDFQLVGLGTETGVNRFTYGVWFGGGYEWDLGKSPLSFFVEANINPDIGRQVFIPAGLRTQYTDPVSGQPIYTTQQKVNNLIFELSIGLKVNR
jgi:hypothetical protein